MRDKWFTRMNGGMLPIEERGMLVTLWDWGQPITATDEEMAAIMKTKEWYQTAASLAGKGKIAMTENNGWTTIAILMPDARRREQMKKAQRKRRGRQQ